MCKVHEGVKGKSIKLTAKDIANGREMQRQRIADENIWRSRMSGYFLRQKKELLKAIEKSQNVTEIRYNGLAVIEPSGLEKIYYNLYPSLGWKFYKNTQDQLLKKSTHVTAKERIDYSDPWWQDAELFVQTQVATRITGVNAVSQAEYEKIIRAAVSKGIEEGWGVEKVKREIEKNVDSKWIAMRKNRARLISRTEMATVANYASYQGALNIASDNNLTIQKAWLSYKDGRTRDDHREMLSTEFIPNEDLFVVGSDRMAYPGDSSHGAGANQICNCRCVTIWKAD